MRLPAIALACVITFASPVLAAPVAITGGTTAVRVTADLAGLGLTPGLLGTATIDLSIPELTRILFPITGGTLDPATLGGQIEHDGSGVSLTGTNGNVLALTDFVIDTVASTLLGDVALNGTGLGQVTLFTFDLTGLTPAQITNTLNPQIRLLFSADAAGALTSAFGAPDLTGAQFGLAGTAPTLAETPAPVPAPAAAALILFGLAGLAMGRAAPNRR